MKPRLQYQAAQLALGYGMLADDIKQTIRELYDAGIYIDEFLPALDRGLGYGHARMEEMLPVFHAALAHFGLPVLSGNDAVN